MVVESAALAWRPLSRCGALAGAGRCGRKPVTAPRMMHCALRLYMVGARAAVSAALSTAIFCPFALVEG
jgi:hypothetical protein